MRPLPTVTSRGVKYTHDINDTVPHSDRGPTRIRPIPQEHTPKEVKPHTPTAPHRVRRPVPARTVATVRPDLVVLTPRLARSGRTV